MSDRKVLNKYYPTDFDPKLVPKVPIKPNQTVKTRLMLPFTCQCIKCGEFMFIGRKFNGRKENSGEKYLNIIIWRFYFRCSRCLAEITFKIDPQNRDYICEHGATRTFDTKQELIRKLAEEKEKAAKEEDINMIESLETKAQLSRRQALEAAALEELHESALERDKLEVDLMIAAQRKRKLDENDDHEFDSLLEAEATSLFRNGTHLGSNSTDTPSADDIFFHGIELSSSDGEESEPEDNASPVNPPQQSLAPSPDEGRQSHPYNTGTSNRFGTSTKRSLFSIQKTKVLGVEEDLLGDESSGPVKRLRSITALPVAHTDEPATNQAGQIVAPIASASDFFDYGSNSESESELDSAANDTTTES